MSAQPFKQRANIALSVSSTFFHLGNTFYNFRILELYERLRLRSQSEASLSWRYYFSLNTVDNLNLEKMRWV